jgi:methylated-DNA-[protein]-cysteine S-methyltransferase
MEEQAVAAPSLRVLVPSPLGSLGVEFVGRRVTSLVITPPRAQRKHFATLKEADRSEFLDEALGRLSEYFAGARRDPQIEIDLGPSNLPDFHRQVLLETQRIPYGTTRSYQKLASAAGDPDAYRLVRSILMANPVPILIPCHRVVTRKGAPGSYIGGERKKAWLLKLEAKGVSGL